MIENILNLQGNDQHQMPTRGPCVERLDVGTRSPARVASTVQCVACVTLFKSSKGFAVVWVPITFYDLDMCNILVDHILKILMTTQGNM